MTRWQAVDERRLHEVTVCELASGQPASPRKDAAPVTRGHRDGFLVRRHCVFIDDGPEVDVAIERIADLDLLRLLDEQPHELVANRFVQVDTRTRRTLLTLRAE